MATTDIPLPGYTPTSGGETPPPGGMRGEVADNPDLERPELRREVAVEGARRVVVEDSSGTAFAEAAGVSGLVAPQPAPIEPAAPAAEAEGFSLPSPVMIALALAGGVLLAMLTGSSRRRAEPDSPSAG